MLGQPNKSYKIFRKQNMKHDFQCLASQTFHLKIFVFAYHKVIQQELCEILFGQPNISIFYSQNEMNV